MLFSNWYFLGVKNISSHAHKTDLGTSWGSFQNLRRAPPFFLYGSPPYPQGDKYLQKSGFPCTGYGLCKIRMAFTQ